MTWFAIQLRRLADARAATASLMGLVLVTSFLFGVAPRAIDSEADRALRSTVEAAAPDTRGITIAQSGRMSAGSPDPMAIVEQSGVLFEQRFPSSVASLVGGTYEMVDTPRFRPSGREAVTVRLRYLQGAAERMRLLDGRMPGGRTSLLPIAADTITNEVTGLNRDLPQRTNLTTFEVALSASNARDLGVKTGDVVMLRTDQSDKLAGWCVSTMAIKVVGIYEIDDPSADYWFADTSLDHPQIRSTSPLNQIDDLTALIAPEAYPSLVADTLAVGLPLRYTWRFEVDTSLLRAGGIDVLAADLKRLESVFLAASAPHPYSYAGPADTMGPLSMQTGLGRLVASYSAGWRTVSQILSIAEVGAAAVALLALSLVCLLAGRRRSGSLAVWRNRGASRFHILRAAGTEAAVEVIGPVALGGVLAVAILPSRPLQPTLVGVGAVLALAAALLVSDAISGSHDPGGSSGGNGLGGNGRARGAEGGRGLAALTRGATPRRLVLETVVVIVAGAGAFLLRQRGVEATRSDAALSSPDPLVAAVPVLIGGAAALLVVRLLPLPLDVMSRLAQKGRGLVAVLALQRATRRTNDRLLLAALLTMAAVWSFAAVSLTSLSRASDAAAWQSVGADYRVSLREGTLPAELTLASVPGVESVAGAAAVAGHVPGSNAGLSILAVDLAAYDDVTRGGVLDGVLPRTMLESESGAARAVTPGEPLPVIVSPSLANDNHLQVGSSFEIVLGGTRPAFTVAAIRDTFPTLAAGSNWMVVGRESLAAAIAQDVVPTEAFLRAGPGAQQAVADFVQARMPGVGLVASRLDTATALRGSPVYSAVIFGLWAATLIAAAYGALAILAALLLAGAEQSRESAHLRVLGVSRVQSLGLSAMEHGPVSILVIAAGIALGVGLFAFLQPSLGLGGLVGGQVQASLEFGLLDVAGIVGAIGLVVALAVGLETAAESIINPTAALRRGMD